MGPVFVPVCEGQLCGLSTWPHFERQARREGQSFAKTLLGNGWHVAAIDFFLRPLLHSLGLPPPPQQQPPPFLHVAAPALVYRPAVSEYSCIVHALEQVWQEFCDLCPYEQERGARGLSVDGPIGFDAGDLNAALSQRRLGVARGARTDTHRRGRLSCPRACRRPYMPKWRWGLHTRRIPFHLLHTASILHTGGGLNARTWAHGSSSGGGNSWR